MTQRRSGAHIESRKDTRSDSEGLWDWNLESDRVYFSPRWITLVGCDDHEVGGTPDDWFQRVHPEDSAALARDLESARSGQATTFACRHRLRHKDGAYRWMLCRGTVLRNKAGQAIRLTGSHSDVTVEMVTDSLTGLPNRLLLMDRLTHSIERAHRHKGFHFAVLVIDLGRPATGVSRAAKPVSDPIVTAVARRLETCLRIPDTMWLVIYVLSGLAMFMVGLENGYAGRHNLIAVVALALAYSAVILLIASLDRPTGGLLKVSQQALVDVQRFIQEFP